MSWSSKAISLAGAQSIFESAAAINQHPLGHYEAWLHASNQVLAEKTLFRLCQRLVCEGHCVQAIADSTTGGTEA